MNIYKASKTPADLAGSGWYEILAPPPPPEHLVGDITADWVIIGAGFAGLSAAMRLTERRPNDKVVVLDAQRIAWGSSGRNSGIMVDLPHDLASHSYAGGLDEDRKQIRMNRVAIKQVADNVERFGLHDHFAPIGKYHGAVDQRGMDCLTDFCRHLDKLNEPYTVLDRAQMHELTGSEFYFGGIHAPGAVVLQSAGYIRGLADGLREQVAIYENSPVMKIESSATHIVHTPQGKIAATNIILATNGHAQSLGFHHRKLMHLFTYASMTHALSEAEQKKLGGQTEWGLIPADPLATTVRRYRDRVVIRHTFTYNPSITTSATTVARIGRHHDRSFRDRFPMLEGVTMEHRWGGAFCISLNSVPAFGIVEERIYSVVCQNGLGMSKGTYGGIAVVDLATGEDNQIVADALSFDPPKKLYPEPFMTLAAKAVLWWKQKKAAGEF